MSNLNKCIGKIVESSLWESGKEILYLSSKHHRSCLRLRKSSTRKECLCRFRKPLCCKGMCCLHIVTCYLKRRFSLKRTRFSEKYLGFMNADTCSLNIGMNYSNPIKMNMSPIKSKSRKSNICLGSVARNAGCYRMRKRLIWSSNSTDSLTKTRSFKELNLRLRWE